MKYRLLKDLPGVKAGEILETFEEEILVTSPYPWVEPNRYPDFFAPVEEDEGIKKLDEDISIGDGSLYGLLCFTRKTLIPKLNEVIDTINDIRREQK